MKLLSVIVNFRTAEMTMDSIRACLRETASIPDSHISVVDNDSGDGSWEKLVDFVNREGLGDRVRVIKSPLNGGFGYGNNVAIRLALEAEDKPDYIYLLNSDAFPDPGAITELLNFMESHPDVGITGSWIHGEDGAFHHTVFRFPSWQSELESALRFSPVTKLLGRYRVMRLPVPTEPTELDWTAGCSFMMRKQMLEQIGLFDESFFLYFEETDLCKRAKQAGWSTYYIPSSRVTHIGSVSTGMKNTSKPVPSFWFQSREHYFRKNHGSAYLVLANVLWLVGFALWRVRRVIQRKPDNDPPHLMRDFFRHNFLHKTR